MNMRAFDQESLEYFLEKDYFISTNSK